MDGFDAHKLGVQALGTFSITLTSFVICFGIFKTGGPAIGLRATDTEQIDGLDFAEHAANAYPDFQTTEQA
jgi:Amt family ammonium transporter